MQLLPRCARRRCCGPAAPLLGLLGRHLLPIPSPSNTRQPYSSSTLVTSPPRHEHFTVPSRSNGAVTLDVFHASTPASPILIYLPSGPVLPDYAEQEDRIIAALAASSGATVARIVYRASSTHPFPTPLHDVLVGYDWVKDNLLQDGFSRPRLATMGVCGELMGASLAVTLALTECRRGEARIGAAAVNNPIADWVFPDDLPTLPTAELHEPLRPEETAFPAEEDPMSPELPLHEMETLAISENGAAAPPTRKQSKRTPKPPQPTSWQMYGDNTVIPTLTLSAERDMLFRKLDHCFDRFISPVHFFRSPHGILLLPKDDDTLASEHVDRSLDPETLLDIDHFRSFEQFNSPELPTLARCRAYARIYPPAGFDLSLPVWHVTTGSKSPLLDQGTELTRLIKRSIARQTLKQRSGRSRWHDTAEKAYYGDYADSRVQVDNMDGLGLWTLQDEHSGWLQQVERVGAFMKETLKPEFA